MGSPKCNITDDGGPKQNYNYMYLVEGPLISIANPHAFGRSLQNKLVKVKPVLVQAICLTQHRLEAVN